MISHSAKALAGMAATELLTAHPELSALTGPDAFARWQNLFWQMLEELSAALELQRPQLFCEYVCWLKPLLAARGVSVELLSSAVERLNQVLQAELPGPAASEAAAVCRDASKLLLQEQPYSDQRDMTADPMYGRLVGEYLLALLEGDRERAVGLVVRAAEQGRSIHELYLQVLLAAQEEAGRMWQNHEINVAEEHFVTVVTKAVMAQLRSRAIARASNGQTLVVASVAGNQHDLGLQAVADFFELDGWRVINLGADVPTRDLVEAVGFYQADVLGLAACLRPQLLTLKHAIQAVRSSQRGRSIRIIVGGRAFRGGAADLAAELGADGYAADPHQALLLAGQLVGLTGKAQTSER